MNEVSLYNKHYQFHSKLDNVDTPNLSRIKEISKRIYFAATVSYTHLTLPTNREV